MKHKIRVDKTNAGQRLDSFLARNLEHSRSSVQQAVSQGRVKVDGAVATKKSLVLAGGEWIEFSAKQTVAQTDQPEDIPLDIRYEDMWLLVINKPPGMVVHPAPGHHHGTLVNALVGRGASLSEIGAEGGRPGIVHRLDKDTSGLLLVAKTNLVHRKLAAMLKQRTIKRTYIALVHGCVDRNRGRISGPIGRHPRNRVKMAIVEEGKRAVSDFRVLRRYEKYTLVEVKLQTGRTHQIRVHFSHLGWPVVGDEVYCRRERDEYEGQGQMLHARTLRLNHPISGVPLSLTAPPPRGFIQFLRCLHSDESGGRQ